MSFAERPVVFGCEDESLVGIVSHPIAPKTRGILVVVGGPQYRVGSHRQFVLLARRLAEQGYPVFRFDCRGMGDGSGAQRTFENIDADIAAALAAFYAACAELTEVVLWGLCDGASAAMMYCARDPRVHGLVALNPWVRTEQSLARTHVKHYYGRRLLEREFWRKLLTGSMGLRTAARSFVQNLQAASRKSAAGMPAGERFQDRMLEGLRNFQGKVLLVLSGNDMTAREFEEYTQDPRWRSVLATPLVSRVHVDDADHTFSNRTWRTRVEEGTLRWLQSW
jgi:exosortase A-associated hydrolase 1